MNKLRVSALGAALGALVLAGLPMKASAMPVAPASKVSLDAPTTDVAYRAKARGHRTAKRVKVRRHYVGRHYYRRNSAVPAAAFGLFAGALGAAIASSSYDDYYYPSYGYGYYPAYSYGYGYPAYNYGYYPRQRYYGQRFYGGPRYVHGGYGGPRYVRGGFGGQRFVNRGFGGPRGGFVRGGGGFGGHRGGVMHVGGGRHR